MKTLIIAEHALNAYSLCSGASENGEVYLLLLGGEIAPERCSDVVLKLSAPENAILDDAAPSIARFIEDNGIECVYAEPTLRIKNIVGQVGGMIGSAAITDVTAFDDEGATNLYFGGLAEKRQTCKSTVALFTVGSGLFDDMAVEKESRTENMAWMNPEHPVKVLSSAPVAMSDIDLRSAANIVAVGRGITDENQLELVKQLCEMLNAQLGCTRPIAENEGWLPHETYIGVSGVMLKPEGYLGIGLSGQMQHMVGVNRAKTILAINKDRNAPVFKQSDYGLVGDIKDVLPALLANW